MKKDISDYAKEIAKMAKERQDTDFGQFVFKKHTKKEFQKSVNSTIRMLRTLINGYGGSTKKELDRITTILAVAYSATMKTKLEKED